VRFAATYAPLEHECMQARATYSYQVKITARVQCLDGGVVDTLQPGRDCRLRPLSQILSLRRVFAPGVIDIPLHSASSQYPWPKCKRTQRALVFLMHERHKFYRVTQALP
jgi:hypothetical protein